MTSSKGKTYKEALQDKLRKEILNITFEKVNGETRIMRCTLIPEYLPVGDNTYLVEGEIVDKPHRKESPDRLSVWDLDKNGWRSMRVENISDVRRV